MIGFSLPDSFKEGDGTLTCVIDDQGVIETASKSIPILMNKIEVKCYPEGGDLIEDLECGFYIECFTKQGDPADLLGEIVDQNGNTITELNTIVREKKFSKLNFFFFSMKEEEKLHLHRKMEILIQLKLKNHLELKIFKFQKQRNQVVH